DVGGFRCNVFHQRHTPAAVVRMIPLVIPSLDHLGLPEVVKSVAMRHQGLVLFTGATGSGKSTSLAAMIQYMNETRFSHIITIEDPIEFVFKDARCSITQREVGEDTLSVSDALVAGLRQDPDVIMLGELRDTTTIQAALTAAETGHLVIATLHTNDAKSTIDRILDAFPADARNMIRIQLAHTLAAVIAQKLVLRADGKGRTVATEILINSPTIAMNIMDNMVEKIPETMENSGNYYNMHTLNKDLERLVACGAVTMEEALQSSHNPEDLKLRLSGIQREG
ncbi:MAG: PilT/PilU family type 4a pilus ATPase, partial [Bdellovibrionota bacterium]